MGVDLSAARFCVSSDYALFLLLHFDAFHSVHEKMDQDAGKMRVGRLDPIAPWSKPFVVAGFVLLIVSGLVSSTALAQKSFSPTPRDGAQNSTPSGANDSQQTGTGSLSGTVLDTNRDVLQGARVTLADPSGSVIRTVESGSNGQFAFTGLPPDVYKLTVTAPGMSTFTSTQIPLRAGEVPYCATGNPLGFRREPPV